VSPQLLRILDGRDATFHCRASGSRPPQVTWSKVGGVSDPCFAIRIITGGNGAPFCNM